MSATRKSHSVEIAPSILASDFLRLGQAVELAETAGAERLHIDVMDGRFVPNITIGQPIVRAIRSTTDMFLETHLMIVEPERYVEDFAQAGANLITVHCEVSAHLYRTVQHIQACGMGAGVAINPGTPWNAVEEVLDIADLILVMTVNPGFGGQEFIETALRKVRVIRAELDQRGANAWVEVDGGINPITAQLAAAAGAQVLVAGTSLYGAADGLAAGMARLRAAVQ